MWLCLGFSPSAAFVLYLSARPSTLGNVSTDKQGIPLHLSSTCFVRRCSTTLRADELDRHSLVDGCSDLPHARCDLPAGRSKQTDQPIYLLFFFCAVGVAGIAGFELALMRAETVAHYGVLMRWAQVPVSLVVVSLVGFIRCYLKAGRIWMLWLICALRSVTVVLAFVLTPNVNYRSITGLRHLAWWGGESVTIAIGKPNPWVLVAQLSVLLLLVFCIEATIAAWRRGDRQRALIVGGSAIFFITASLAQTLLILSGKLEDSILHQLPLPGNRRGDGLRTEHGSLPGDPDRVEVEDQ